MFSGNGLMRRSMAYTMKCVFYITLRFWEYAVHVNGISLTRCICRVPPLLFLLYISLPLLCSSSSFSALFFFARAMPSVCLLAELHSRHLRQKRLVWTRAQRYPRMHITQIQVRCIECIGLHHFQGFCILRTELECEVQHAQGIHVALQLSLEM